MYTAIVLTNKSALELKAIAIQTVDLSSYNFATAAGMVLPHHMTVNMDGYDSELNDESLKGMDCKVTIDGIAYNHTLGICAARVLLAETIHDEAGVSIESTNTQAHITVAIKPTSKPAWSNKLKWENNGDDKFVAIEPFEVIGNLQECL